MFNTGQHIDEVMMKSACGKHDAPKGEACWVVPVGDNFEINLRAICGRRIEQVFNGKISLSSISTKKTSTKKEVRA